MPSSEFMKLEFQGRRFEGGELPLDILRDLTALKGMVLEVAKWKFREDHPERKRSPKGLTRDIDLKIIRIDSGSAVPVLGLCSTQSQGNFDIGLPYQKYFEDSASLIIQSIEAEELGQDQKAEDALPNKYLAYFDRVGRNLQEEESLRFIFSARNEEATLTQDIRRALLSRSRIKELTQQVALRGSIPEADQERMTFELQQIYGSKIGGRMNLQHLDTIVDAFAGYLDGTKVYVEGIGKYSQENRLLSLELIEQINILDPLDVPARLNEMKNLTDDWASGMQALNTTETLASRAPNHEGLDWLAAVFEQLYPDSLTNPYAYPTLEGGVQIEWSIGRYEATLEINLEERRGEWHSINLDSKESILEELTLDEQGWLKVIENIRNQESSPR